jgi:hypothetical protein
VIAEARPYSRVELVLTPHLDPHDAIDRVAKAPAWAPFSAPAVEFVSALSNLILRGTRFRQLPELIAFGYQMRRKAVEGLRPTLAPASARGLIRGRGLALHFAPANVDTIFLYSLLLSLLAGNANIVRLSSKGGPQVELMVDAIRSLLSEPEHEPIRDRIVLVRYPHDQEITDRLAARCDLRVIWGGDVGVSAIRRSPLPFLAREVVFPDRWSMAVLDAEAFQAAENSNEIARLLVNDSYWFGQMACSSPRMIVWRGGVEACRGAASTLFAHMSAHAAAFAADMKAIDYVNKRVFEDTAAIDLGGTIYPTGTTLVSVVDVDAGQLVLPEDHTGGGSFLHGRVDHLRDLAPLMTRKLQTVVSYGVAGNDWRDFLEQEQVAGVDRIVPVGSALDFAAVWDGMSLLREFTRETIVAV